MRPFWLTLGAFALALLIACSGGGDDDSSDDSGSSGNDGGGGGGNFCTSDNFNELNDVNFSDLDNLEAQFEALDDHLDDWADDAPGEIEDDVEFVTERLRGLIDLLRENNFNFLALATSQDDPRLTALDSSEFTEATDRIGDFCGFDFNAPSPSGGVPGGLGGSGGSDGSPGTDGGSFTDGALPEELIPPDSEVEGTINVGVAQIVQFNSTATIDQIRDYYNERLGDPLSASSDGIVWLNVQGTNTVTVSGASGALMIGISTAAAP